MFNSDADTTHCQGRVFNLAGWRIPPDDVASNAGSWSRAGVVILPGEGVLPRGACNDGMDTLPSLLSGDMDGNFSCVGCDGDLSALERGRVLAGDLRMAPLAALKGDLGKSDLADVLADVPASPSSSCQARP